MQREINDLTERGRATRQQCEAQIAEVRQQLEHVTAERDEARAELEKARQQLAELLDEATKPAPPPTPADAPVTL